MNNVAVGIDIGGTNTAIGLVTREGRCVAQTTISTTASKEVAAFVDAIASAIESLQSDAGAELAGIGIGAPNGNYYNGTIEFAPNLPWRGVIKLAELVKLRTGLPAVLTNDANAAAIGEMIYGGAKGMKEFIIITLGTGLGSGIVTHGELVYGHDGFAGEIGHTIVDPDGRLCGCGRRGCLETYVSAPGICRTLLELMGEMTTPSALRDMPPAKLTAAHIADAAHKGDALALEAFERTGKTLGLKLADAVAHTSPEAIFLFGGLANAGPLIFDPTRKHMEGFMLNIFKGKVKLLPSSLKENAAVLGASALVWKEIVA